MKQLIERLLKIQETFDRRTIVAIGKVYKDHSRGLDPDPIQVETAYLKLISFLDKSGYVPLRIAAVSIPLYIFLYA